MADYHAVDPAPPNTALAVGPAIEYVKVKCRNPYTDRPQTVILAKGTVPAYFTKKMEGTYEITGESLAGSRIWKASATSKYPV